MVGKAFSNARPAPGGGALMSKAPHGWYDVVRLLRAMQPREQHMALYASQFWSDERLDLAERVGDLPGRPSEVQPKTALVQ